MEAERSAPISKKWSINLDSFMKLPMGRAYIAQPLLDWEDDPPKSNMFGYIIYISGRPDPNVREYQNLRSETSHGKILFFPRNTITAKTKSEIQEEINSKTRKYIIRDISTLDYIEVDQSEIIYALNEDMLTLCVLCAIYYMYTRHLRI